MDEPRFLSIGIAGNVLTAMEDAKTKQNETSGSVTNEGPFKKKGEKGSIPAARYVLAKQAFLTGFYPDTATRRTVKNLLSALSDDELTVIADKVLKPEAVIVRMKKPSESSDIKLLIGNAGLAILSPYLPVLFQRLGYLESGKFKTKTEAHKAICVLQYLCTGRQKHAEYDLMFNKILCGISPAEPVPANKRLSINVRKEADGLLQSVIENWKALGSISIGGFRSSFLLRKGNITSTETGWTLRVEKQSYDLLLDKIPWAFHLIKFPWMKKMIQVEW